MTKKQSLFGAAVAVAFVFGSAAELAAQVCIGFPTTRGQGAAAVTANFPTGGSDFGVEAGYHVTTQSSVFGGFNVHTPDEGDNVTSFGAGGAFALPELRAALMPSGLYSCPTVSFSIANVAGDEDLLTVPVGIGFGTILPVGGMTVSPYVVPQIRWTSFADETSTEWGLSGGAILVGFLGPRVYAGATVDRVFLEGAESVLGLKIGMTF